MRRGIVAVWAAVPACVWVLAAAGCTATVDGAASASGPGPVDGGAAGASVSAAPRPSAAPAPTTSVSPRARDYPDGTDGAGWTGPDKSAARCDGPDDAVVIGGNDAAFFVVCAAAAAGRGTGGPGDYEYRGMQYFDGGARSEHMALRGVRPAAGGFDSGFSMDNAGSHYTVTPDRFTLTSPTGAVVYDAPLTVWWARR